MPWRRGWMAGLSLMLLSAVPGCGPTDAVAASDGLRSLQEFMVDLARQVVAAALT